MIYDTCGQHNPEDHPFVDAKVNPDHQFKWIHYGELSKRRKPRLREKFGDKVPNAALDLIAKLLDLNPEARPSAEDVLEHKWFHTAPLPCLPHECVFLRG